MKTNIIHFNDKGKYSCNWAVAAEKDKMSKRWDNINCKNCRKMHKKGKYTDFLMILLISTIFISVLNFPFVSSQSTPMNKDLAGILPTSSFYAIDLYFENLRLRLIDDETKRLDYLQEIRQERVAELAVVNSASALSFNPTGINSRESIILRLQTAITNINSAIQAVPENISKINYEGNLLK